MPAARASRAEPAPVAPYATPRRSDPMRLIGAASCWSIVAVVAWQLFGRGKAVTPPPGTGRRRRRSPP